MAGFGTIQQVASLVLALSTPSFDTGDAEDFFYLRDPLPTRLIPEFTPCTVSNKQYACFDKGQVNELFILEIQAQYWHQHWIQGLQLVTLKDVQLANLTEQLARHAAIEASDSKYIKDLNSQLVKEVAAKNSWRTKAENPPTWPLWVGGTLAVLGAGAFLGSLLQ
jgi:hypothetical protein